MGGHASGLPLEERQGWRLRGEQQSWEGRGLSRHPSASGREDLVSWRWRRQVAGEALGEPGAYSLLL